MAETDGTQLECPDCTYKGCTFSQDDGRFYCDNCNSQVADIIDTGVADEDFIDKGGPGGTQAGPTYDPRYSRPAIKSEPIINLTNPSDHMGPSHPADFGGSRRGGRVEFEDDVYYGAVRQRYVLGVQLMVQLQCEGLVEKFKVNPIVCGIAGSVWLRFVAGTRVFEDNWAHGVVDDSETNVSGEKKRRVGNHPAFVDEPHNSYMERNVMIWIKSLKKAIPISCSLAVSYLACHIAREPVLPTDIVRWSIEGKLPYFDAYPKIEGNIIQIEREHQRPSIICPLQANYMFRPRHAVHPQKLESMAASIARSVGLRLPPVNFCGIASRYLKQLSLPVGKIISYACRIQEWSMPPDLWLSTDEFKPTRVCVMSILIVAIRILYDINGFGQWEMALSAPFYSSMGNKAESFDVDNASETSTPPTMDEKPVENSSSVHVFESECAELLQKLHKEYDGLNDGYGFSKDLPTYLKYCKDVVFAGLEPLYKDPGVIEELWDFYQQNQEDFHSLEEPEDGFNLKRSKDSNRFSGAAKVNKKHRDDETTSSSSANSSGCMFPDSGIDNCPSSNTFQSSQGYRTSATTAKGRSIQNLREIAIRHMKIDMEEHRFSYIPPRTNVKRHDYLYYGRKEDGSGSYTYVAHADYYILLRACAKVAQVDVRVLHASVLSLERRLGGIEKAIDQCIQQCHNDVRNINLSNENS